MAGVCRPSTCPSIMATGASVQAPAQDTLSTENSPSAVVPSGGRARFFWTADASSTPPRSWQAVPQQRVRDLFSGKLGLSPEQMHPLGELVCAAMALRQSLLDDYAHGQSGEAETWQQLTQVRKELTSQMAEVLGEDRYREFRSAGGIGALAMVIDCEG